MKLRNNQNNTNPARLPIDIYESIVCYRYHKTDTDIV